MRKKAGRNPTENVGIRQASNSRIKISKLGEHFSVFQQVPLGAIIFRERQLVTLNIVLTQQAACPNLLYFHLHYWFENSPGFMIHIMLAHVLLETEMLSLHFALFYLTWEKPKEIQVATGTVIKHSEPFSIGHSPWGDIWGARFFSVETQEHQWLYKSLPDMHMYIYVSSACVHANIYTYVHIFFFLQENCRKRSVIITYKFG